MKRITITGILAVLLLGLTGAISAKGNFIFSMGATGMPRAAHTATLMGDEMLGTQMVLLAGGMQEDGVSTTETTIFDNLRGTFRKAPSMTIARAGHTATQLQDRRILMLGGYADRTPVTTAELYVPKDNAFVSLGDAPISGGGFTATRLDDGRVLIAGGGDDTANAAASLFNPYENTFSATGALNIARTGHTATLLDDGRVLIVGGSDGENVVASAEIYDPATDTFTLAGDLLTARYKHGAVKLADGRVLVMGGSTADDWTTRMTSAEIYDPASGTFSATGDLLTPRFKFADATLLMNNGMVIVAGGGVPEVYDPATGLFAHLPGDRLPTRYYATASKLGDGAIVIMGGYNEKIDVTNEAWMYLPPSAM